MEPVKADILSAELAFAPVKAKKVAKPPIYYGLYLLAFLAVGCIASNHWSEGLYGDTLFNKLIPQEQFSVDVFFGVEGFLCAFYLSGLTKNHVFPVIIQRILRILPLYMLGLGAGIFCVYWWGNPHMGNWGSDSLLRIIHLNLGLMPYLTESGGAVFPFNPPSWALILELWVFAFLCLFWKRLNFKRVAIICGISVLAICACYVWLRDPNPGWQAGSYWGGIPRAIYGFLMGALVYLGTQSQPKTKYAWKALLAALLFVGILFLRFRGLAVPLQILAMPLLIWLASAQIDPSPWLSPILWAQSITYSLYFLHHPLEVAYRTLCKQYAVSREFMASPEGYVFAMGMFLLIAFIVTKLIDEPLNRLFTPKPAPPKRVVQNPAPQT